MNASHAQQTTTAPESPAGTTGITTRPPRVLVATQRCAGTTEGATDPVRIRQHLNTGGYTRPPAPAVIVYRMGSDRHRQTGVVVEVSIDDYRTGRIRRHEATQPERERRLNEIIEATGIEHMPVTLAHPSRARLSSLLTEIAAGEPDVHLDAADGITHTAWIRHDAELARTIQDELGHIDTLYIADGHHRMAAAERYAGRRSRLGEDHAGAFTLAALFPSDEMRILGYHRCLPLPEGMSASDVLERLAAQPVTARVEECASTETASPAPGIVTVRLDGRSYRLWLRAPRESEHVRASLDIVTLDEELLPAMFGTVESRPRGAPVFAAENTGGATCWCAERDAIGFFPHPPSVEQVMAVSDAGLVMPPKSTCFHPKAGAGLFARELF
ncbi:uncharacterized protein (DUF1015 family) [Halopolyspora algeriensis]|uniref:Uncharacterized protein (DUF1015 family) n=1 Tax=Halopolyspora algeriensis TaxID=1500506 RepID=A0A368VV50_9ACTN|nr:DUF1015 domain-containing protein [Halopolyspora algeriensis]RCW45723.1 uncharacterized protein (DUF1015 family) [Halopolyspora algeriensis]TQM54107.1 uncharacterized protein (DUF1015 family) [Halopolyspora algeriensis]